MPPAEEAAIVSCLGEVKSALAGLEAAAQATLRTNEVRLHELELRTTRESAEVRAAAEEDAKRDMQKAEALEARVEKLEDKYRSKKAEIVELRAQIEKLTAKLQAKSEQLFAIEDRRANGVAAKAVTAEPVPTERQAAAEAAAAGHRASGGRRSGSSEGGAEEEERTAAAKPKAKDDEGRGRGRKRAESEDERSCSSEDSSPPTDQRKHRVERGKKEARSQSREGRARSDSSSWSRASRCGRERGRAAGSREPRSRDRARGRAETRSCDSRGQRGRGGHRRDTGSPGRKDSRSRSRRPWRHGSGGKGGGGKGGGKGREGSGLCIPFVMGKCHWGDKCRDRHPDAEDARIAKDNLQNKLCRFGMDCRRKDCIFKHPDGKRRDRV